MAGSNIGQKTPWQINVGSFVLPVKMMSDLLSTLSTFCRIFCPLHQKDWGYFVHSTKRIGDILSTLPKGLGIFCPTYQKDVESFVQPIKIMWDILSTLKKRKLDLSSTLLKMALAVLSGSLPDRVSNSRTDSPRRYRLSYLDRTSMSNFAFAIICVHTMIILSFIQILNTFI